MRFLPVRLVPPSLSLLSTQHYVAQGGAEAVVYQAPRVGSIGSLGADLGDDLGEKLVVELDVVGLRGMGEELVDERHRAPVVDLVGGDKTERGLRMGVVRAAGWSPWDGTAGR